MRFDMLNGLGSISRSGRYNVNFGPGICSLKWFDRCYASWDGMKKDTVSLLWGDLLVLPLATNKLLPPHHYNRNCSFTLLSFKDQTYNKLSNFEIIQPFICIKQIDNHKVLHVTKIVDGFTRMYN